MDRLVLSIKAVNQRVTKMTQLRQGETMSLQPASVVLVVDTLSRSGDHILGIPRIVVPANLLDSADPFETFVRRNVGNEFVSEHHPYY